MGVRFKRIKDMIMTSQGFSSSLEVCGTGEMLLTGCICLLDFSDTEVRAETVNGEVTVSGRCLEICTFRADILFIKGSIKNITFEEVEV